MDSFASKRTLAAAAVAVGVAVPVALWISRGELGGKSAEDYRALVNQYCLDCHNAAERTADLSLQGLDLAHPEQHAGIWEDVIRKLRVGMMPPSDMPQPSPQDRADLIGWLEAKLDAAVRQRPDPGPTLVRRLNRAEYQNAIRDLLHLEIDSTAYLPPDDSAYGFDNNAEALVTSPMLVEQYLGAAGEIAALAVGDTTTGAVARTLRVRQDASQNVQVASMPVGTVGGNTWRVVLSLDGEYRLDVTFFKSNLGAMKGLEMAHEFEIAVDGERVHSAIIGGPDDFNALMRNITEAADEVEARASTTVPLSAGPHDVSIGFVYQSAALTSVRLQPFERSSQDILDVTGHPHVETLTITGPFNVSSPGETPSRQRIFVCTPETTDEAVERACAQKILSTLARRAYRGFATPRDVEILMDFYDRARAERGFEAGIQTALERLLASPKFAFRVERAPDGVAPGEMYRLPSLDLASRLSFFLWSSIPDDELLDLAERDELRDPKVLEAQVRRMLADPKSQALVDNFAGQWLYLRNVESFVPNSEGFPDFDDNLRQGFLTETRLFFESIMREDRNVLDLMNGNYTFLNERVARHYGIPGVYGAHFRRVELKDEARWGLLGKGSVLMASSHTDRTSPVVRGKWVLTELLGVPPPVPPPDVPALEEVDAEGKMTLRQRTEAHRANPVCSACHVVMDPIGFALENFDAVGAWRDYEYGRNSHPIDASGRLADGTEVNGPIELRRELVRKPEMFVGTMVEKMMIYALGRGTVPSDMPVIRQIVRDAADEDYRFSAIVLGIVNSVPFQMRTRPTLEGTLTASATDEVRR
jgi:mono/diheme cytochrome c family protein